MIAFIRSKSGIADRRARLMLMRSDGTNQQALVYRGPSLTTAAEDLAWSPNGRFLAGASRTDANDRFSGLQLTVLNLETLKSRVVYTSPVKPGPTACSLDWSPDSTQLFACTYWADPGPTIRIDVASGQVLQTYGGTDYGAYGVSWSRDGAYLLLQEFGPYAMDSVRIRSVDGSLVRTLCDDPQTVQWTPTYSADGSQYAFIQVTDGYVYIRRANTDGTGLVTVLKLHEVGIRPWSGLAWK